MKNQLKTYLRKNHCVDLYELYFQFKPIALATLVRLLYEIKQELKLTTKLSPLVSQIDKLLPQMNSIDDLNSQIDFLCKEIDISQRAQSMARYIHFVDAHQTFAPQSDLVLFGDSITEWGPWKDVFTNLSHVNRGIAGDTTFGMLRRVETILLVKPKVITIMSGINDLLQDFSVDEVFNHYVKLLEVFQKESCQILVQSTLYCGKTLAHVNSKVTHLNEKLENYCAAKKIAYLNVNAHLNPNHILSNDYSCDDLHLNAKAYSKWLEVLRPRIEQLLSLKGE